MARPRIPRAEYVAQFEADRQKIVDAIKANRKYGEIGKEFGLTAARISQIAKREGIQRRPRKPKQ